MQSLATVVLLHDGGPSDVAPAAALAAALQDRLVAHLSLPLDVAAASLQALPTISEALAGVPSVSLAVPLEPVGSRWGIDAYRAALAAAGHADVEMVGGWQDDERFLRAVTAQARSALGGGRLDAAAVLFVARGLPERGGGEYYDLAQRLAARLVGLMAPGDWRLAFWDAAAAVGGDVVADSEFTDPDRTDSELADPELADPELAAGSWAGQLRQGPLPVELTDLLDWEWPMLLVVPIGQVLESDETRALDERLRPSVEGAGRAYRRAGPVGGDPGFLAAIADAVVDHLARRPLPEPDLTRL